MNKFIWSCGSQALSPRNADNRSAVNTLQEFGMVPTFVGTAVNAKNGTGVRGLE